MKQCAHATSMLESVGFKVGLHPSDAGGPNSRFFNLSRTDQMTEEDVLPRKNMVSIQNYAVVECRIIMLMTCYVHSLKSHRNQQNSNERRP